MVLGEQQMGKAEAENSGILFKNIFVPDRKQLLRAYRRMYFRLTNRQIWVYTIMMGFVMVVALLPFLAGVEDPGQGNAVLFWISVTVLGMLFMAAYLLPSIFALITLHKMKKVGSYGSLITTFYAGKISVQNESAEGETVLRYNAIVNMMETGNLLLLQTVSKQGIILPKDGFTVGNAEGFIHFISKKIGK